jgi:hypothetical protein
MNWFQHDTDATQDAKIKKLIIRHGAVGYAVYFHCLELIAADISESNLTFELEHDSEIIADNLHIKGTADKSGREVVETIMVDIIALGLFTETEGRIFCIKLLKRVSLSMTSSPSFRAAIAQKKEQYHDTVMTRHDLVTTGHETLHYTTLQGLHDKEEREEQPLTFESTCKQISQEWNTRKLGPQFRFTTSLGLNAKEREGFSICVGRYSPDEILKAFDNFGAIIANTAEYDAFPRDYRLPGFLASGVEQYLDDAKPFDRCRKRQAAKQVPRVLEPAEPNPFDAKNPFGGDA